MNSNLTSAHFSLLLAHNGLNAKENIIDTNMDAVYWKKMKRRIISSNDYDDVKCKVQSSQCAANMTHIALGTIKSKVQYVLHHTSRLKMCFKEYTT